MRKAAAKMNGGNIIATWVQGGKMCLSYWGLGNRKGVNQEDDAFVLLLGQYE